MNSVKLVLMLFPVFSLLLGTPSLSAQKTPNISFSELKKANFEEGFFPFYFQEDTGRLLLVVNKIDTDFLYLNALSHGIGSNDIGLDRGRPGANTILRFEKHADKLFLVEPNQYYRAITNDKAEAKAVEEAFATSIWDSFKILDTNDKGDYLIDITSFIVNDAYDISGSLQSRGQGSYRFDANRSAIEKEYTRNFPKNTEFEAIITLSGSAKGREIRSVTPNSDYVSVQIHHSFVELPDNGYKMKEFDPRSGFFGMSFFDYATPIEQPLKKQFVVRHRLEKKDPNKDVSEVVEPIVYYLDPGTPEPIRSALMDGAKWWAEAFEYAGFKNAFIVKMLPEDADPMDVRYNLIQWVHRSTRGWSYGNAITDPRTGEIIKGKVTLGSLRVRQDYLIATGLIGPYKEDGTNETEAATALALARLRQLSAHEIGHTLGLAHNFAASTQNRASVMDYPHPYIQLKNGTIDLSEAYDTQIGEWDKLAIKMGYSDLSVDEVLKGSEFKNLKYISDSDARPAYGIHPDAHLWDSNTDAADELERILQVREAVIKDFDLDRIPLNSPVATLEDAFVPIYLLHRYQIEGTAKMIGGVYYEYAVRNKDFTAPEAVSVKQQKKALSAIIQSIQPHTLTIPTEVLKNLIPKSPGYGRSRETFQSKTGISFDPIAAAETAVDASLAPLLHPYRLNQVGLQSMYDGNQLRLSDIFNEIKDSFFGGKNLYGLEKGIYEMTQARILAYYSRAYFSDMSHQHTKAAVYQALSDIRFVLEKEEDASSKVLVQTIDSIFAGKEEHHLSEPTKIPDGSPIGCFQE